MNDLPGISPPSTDPLRAAIRRGYLAGERESVERLLLEAHFDDASRGRVAAQARRLVLHMRAHRSGGIDELLQEYGLDTSEGVVLMCLAEALVRIPDTATADKLIQEKLTSADWSRHLGRSDSLLVNASTWALMLSGKLLQIEPDAHRPALETAFEKLVARIGEPALRMALRRGMTIVARQFVTGRDINEALQETRSNAGRNLRYSYDMLGEAALTAADAARYFERYREAIDAVGRQARLIQDGAPSNSHGGAPATSTIFQRPGVSVKLSALHPRFEFAQGERLARELLPRVLALAEQARDAGIGMTLDAEESERLEPLLDVFEAVYRSLGAAPNALGATHGALGAAPSALDSASGAYEGFGLAVQAYQKRALAVIAWVGALGRRGRRRIPVRLVKGAYWDGEIKRAQERGLAGYPVFTRKSATDVSYLACARRMVEAADAIYPQFATHNAHTAAALLELLGRHGTRAYEFQRLHGMGESLYAALPGEAYGLSCRVYAPVGPHEDLMPYLIRRLLENGANTSFLHQASGDTAVDVLIADPADALRRDGAIENPRIPLPRHLYPDRKNSAGTNLSDAESLLPLARGIDDVLQRIITNAAKPASPPGAMPAPGAGAHAVVDPANRQRIVGEVANTDAAAIAQAIDAAARAQPGWDAVDAGQRADLLEGAADLIEAERAALMALLVHEGGKCLPDADAEVREAADYCRYYARLARDGWSRAAELAGPTGERNELRWRGRGVFACISPWNFPLAIFLGQAAAALAAGNCAIAKPAHQTPLIADAVVHLLHRAGIPRAVLQCLPGEGRAVGGLLLADERIAGVAFTGSTATAQAINRQLAARNGPIVPLIAETGGINAMLVDSSALPEQAAVDALRSAFNSAGQRCSALRLLYVQEDIAPRLLQLIAGAMEELVVGDPALLSTDVGPVIDEPSRRALQEHAERMASQATLIARTPLRAGLPDGWYFAPQAWEIANAAVLDREVFGPVLHVVRFAGHHLDSVIDAINHSGYGLTLGVHSRIDATVQHVARRARVGNIYVNRNQIGATVGVQPFGGEGLSGTGPKAGGPHYLQRFSVERTLSINTAAVGGNTTLLGLGED